MKMIQQEAWKDSIGKDVVVVVRIVIETNLKRLFPYSKHVAVVVECARMTE